MRVVSGGIKRCGMLRFHNTYRYLVKNEWLVQFFTCSPLFNYFIAVGVFRKQDTPNIQWNSWYISNRSPQVAKCHRVATSLDGPFVCYSFRSVVSPSQRYRLLTYYTHTIPMILLLLLRIETLVTVSYYIIFIRGLMGPSKSLFRFILFSVCFMCTVFLFDAIWQFVLLYTI